MNKSSDVVDRTVEECVYLILAFPMALTVFTSLNDLRDEMEMHISNLGGIFFVLGLLQVCRRLLEKAETTSEVGCSPPFKIYLDFLKDSLIFSACYFSTLKSTSFTIFVGAIGAISVLVRILKHRIYDDYFVRNVLGADSVLHVIPSRPGHFFLRALLAGFRSYLYAAFAFATLQMLTMPVPRGLPENWSFMINGTHENLFVTFVYFNIVTLATVGFGDIYPIKTMTRLLCSAEILFSLLILATIFVTLLTRFQTIAQGKKANE